MKAIPKISIVTVVFNSQDYLTATIESVINQTYENYEYIIIDGGSTDKTIEIIQQYERHIDHWLSESDRGIYDAMNKGIKLAKGDIIGILNSGDLYSFNALTEVARLYNRQVDRDYLVITGAMNRFDEQSGVNFTQVRSESDLHRDINLGMPINHPATFITKKLYERVGYFNSEFKICGDHDLIFRIYHERLAKFIFTEQVLASMSMGGASEKLDSLSIRAREKIIIRKKHLNIFHNLFMSFQLIVVGYIKHLLMVVMGQRAVLLKYKILKNPNR